MAEIKRLVASIVQFLGDQLNSDQLSADGKESLEVAIQCLESAYDVTSSDAHLLPNKSLVDMFKENIKNEPPQPTQGTTPTEESKAEAEQLKNEGNNLMKSEKFEEALKSYTRAIQLDSGNAVFYCNRAAAYSKLNNHSFALQDCKRAIQLDPIYSKAYGRMGLAYASLNDHHQARDCYKKAVELEPDNESYRNNLNIAEEKVAEIERQNPFSGGLGGGLDFSQLISNPALMNMASQLMQDPNMQNLIGNLMGGNVQQPPEGPAGANAGGFDAFLRAGQQIAAQMQNVNPELVEQLRRQMGGPGGPNDNPDPSSDPGNNNDGSGTA